MSRTHSPFSQDSWVGRLAVLHAGVLALFLTWGYGGMQAHIREVATWLVAPAPLLFIWAWLQVSTRHRRRLFGVIVAFGGIAALCAIGFLNPSMQHLELWGESMLRPIPHRVGPSNPYPTETIPDFLLNAGLVLIGLNLMVARPARGWLRGLLTVIALNVTTLATVGTFFKLTGASKILGHTASPNPNFFATFVYHNHWGAVALVGLAVAAGLAAYHDRRRTDDFTLSPAPFWYLCAVIILLAIPLASGRASTGAAAVLTLGLAAFTLMRGRIPRMRVAGILLVGALLVSAVVYALGRNIIRNEVNETRNSLAALQAGKIGEGRIIIYGDTLKLIAERPWFGWGWHSFQYVFPRVASPRPYLQTEEWEQHLLDAHSDWLQIVVELGIVGTGLFFMGVGFWVAWAPRRGWADSPGCELLLGVGAVGLVAAVDFPAACPAVVIMVTIAAGAAAELARGSPRAEDDAPPAP